MTGFEPFGQDTENASAMAVTGLDSRAWPPGLHVATALLPVTWAGSVPVLLRAVRTHAPDVVVAVGEAGGRAVVTPESRARNLGHGRIPDNAGVERPASPLDDGPEWLAARVDPETLVRAIRQAGIPSEVSHDAGAFLCNAVFRALLRDTDLPAAFIHVPAVRTRGVAGVGRETDPRARPLATCLSVERLTEALSACVVALAEDHGTNARTARSARRGRS